MIAAEIAATFEQGMLRGVINIEKILNHEIDLTTSSLNEAQLQTKSFTEHAE